MPAFHLGEASYARRLELVGRRGKARRGHFQAGLGRLGVAGHDRFQVLRETGALARGAEVQRRNWKPGIEILDAVRNQPLDGVADVERIVLRRTVELRLELLEATFRGHRTAV